MIADVVMWSIRCDECRAVFEWEDEGVDALFGTAKAAAEYALGLLTSGAGWTSDGEGKHHCPACPPLELTQAARDEMARVPGPLDVPLDLGDEVRSSGWSAA